MKKIEIAYDEMKGLIPSSVKLYVKVKLFHAGFNLKKGIETYKREDQEGNKYQVFVQGE